MERHAILDAARVYRYTLERTWDRKKERVLFIMLNPSRADETSDDATVQRCKAFANDWGYGGLVVGNLFALIATNPRKLVAHSDPVGPENDSHLLRLGKDCSLVVVAWGNAGKAVPLFQERQQFAKTLFQGRMQCLGENKDGTPKHPGRLAATTSRRSYGNEA